MMAAVIYKAAESRRICALLLSGEIVKGIRTTRDGRRSGNPANKASYVARPGNVTQPLDL